jgi:hypothetical protein
MESKRQKFDEGTVQKLRKDISHILTRVISGRAAGGNCHLADLALRIINNCSVIRHPKTE